MPELTTVPSFVFYQGEPYEEGYESPIEVKYWEKGQLVSLEQPQGNAINISVPFMAALFKEIKKHLPEAEKHLK